MPFAPRRAVALSVCTFACVSVAVASAAASRFGGPFYSVEASTFNYNLGTGAFAVPAHVTIRRPGLEAAADGASGNVRDGRAQLRGNVRVHDAGGKASPQGPKAEPATLTCDQLDIDGKADTYRATGHPKYDATTRHASADTMLYNRKSRTLHLEGDVTVVENATIVHGATIDLDLKKGETTAVGSPVTITRPATTSPSAAPNPSPNPSPSPKR
ncbi:hypothetical protein WPS_08480 [Vulcanimicrobium alpinum]|uniref:Organic solvent tolerance-like N-terminal domain-containing protein n=1 Tax=Vulcanimicrobium alpinum TaxID=3016050 RepID=A0AAN1XWH9_UNVUL|nr:LptA/OstA family protein [Vulcanimicrobium alpinum]BDE05572.1 hypothetical protein WPS_08480 [Vulcanimicrobium alpinum]